VLDGMAGLAATPRPRLAARPAMPSSTARRRRRRPSSRRRRRA